MTVRSTLVISLALMVGCDSGPAKLRRHVFGSPQAIEIVESASTVSAFRLLSPNRFNESLSDFRATAGPIQVSDALASELRLLLLDPSTYLWDAAKGCDPDYGVRIQFQSDLGDVDVLLCFDCDILAVYHDGTAVGGEDFDDVRPELVRIVQELFPDDEALQSLDL